MHGIIFIEYSIFSVRRIREAIIIDIFAIGFTDNRESFTPVIVNVRVSAANTLQKSDYNYREKFQSVCYEARKIPPFIRRV